MADLTTSSMAPEVMVCTDSSDFDRIGDALGSAFRDDPVMLHVTGDLPPEKTMFLFFRAWAHTLLHKPSDKSVVHATSDYSSVAIWFEPNPPHSTWLSRLQTIWWMLPSLGRRAFLMQHMFDVLESQHPAEPHMLLQLLGTHAETQGKGVGSRTIGAMLERCDERGLPAYTESSNERNLPFYKRHGFEILGPVENLPPDFPRLIRLLRQPRAPAA